MENIGIGFLVVFSVAGAYYILALVGIIISSIGEDICRKFGLPGTDGPFSPRDLFVGILAILLISTVLWGIGFVVNRVSDLY